MRLRRRKIRRGGWTRELLLIAIGSALANNVVLSQSLGLCPFLSASKKVETSAGMGAAVIFVITIASVVTSLIYEHVLSRDGILGIDLTFPQAIVLILVIATLVQSMGMFLKKSVPALYEALGVYLPLITTNCTVLGVALTNVQREYGFITSVVNRFGIAMGFTIAIIMLAGIHERIEDNDMPYNFQESPIMLTTSRLMVIAFFEFSGLI